MYVCMYASAERLGKECMKCMCGECRETRESEFGVHINVYECREAEKEGLGMCAIAERPRKKEDDVGVCIVRA